ncbi:MAG: EAL domain-containing protein [Proteobacteria bacterium]|uniref:EAL domain-containing protein n=1 Tax=Rudaea sp. TaxID=2136325 RepID=UPI00321FB81C|nr:EAL domain-containing protein [Pseudomonadota bacterium]
MLRHEKTVVWVILTGLLGIAGLLGTLTWFLWRESVASEDAYSGKLAAILGDRVENIMVDLRDMLVQFDALDLPRCSDSHLDALRIAAMSRPYVRSIGYWQANKRLCAVGFLPAALKPQRADRVYDSGVIAWWPGEQTKVAGVELFLMRFGDHDVAVDPRQLLDLGPMQDRQAELWLEDLPLTSAPWNASLPAPKSLPVGVSLNKDNQRIYARFSLHGVLPIEIVTSEPLGNFWRRHALTLAAGAIFGLIVAAAWTAAILRFSRRQFSAAAALRRAVRAGDISVVYEPMVDLRTLRCIGAEALARWQREDGTWVSPNVFIPLAEESGVMHEVTLAVMRTAVADLARIFAEAGKMTLSLNLSAGDLGDDRFGDQLRESIAEARLPPEAVKLEITERSLIDSDADRARIRELRVRGHQIAIDDFGTGYSSLAYLQSFELDVIKIDKAFVDTIGKTVATSQVIEHIIDMAGSLGLRTAAEGVETAAQARWLGDHGVLLGQGHLFSKPLLIDDFIRFFRSNRHNRET